MRTRNNKNGYKIIDVVYKSEPNGIGFRQLIRKTGLYQKSLSPWLKYLTIDLHFTKKDTIGHIHLTENAIKKYTTNTLIIPPDPRNKKVEKNQIKKQSITKKFDKNYAEIIILILCLAVFGVNKYRLESGLGSSVYSDPIDKNKSYTYKTSSIQGVSIEDMVYRFSDSRIDNEPNKMASFPENRLNMNNNEIFGYLQLTEKDISQYLDYLIKQHSPPILIPIEGNNQRGFNIHYKIGDKLLEKFVQSCVLAFNEDIDERLKYAYIYNQFKRKKEYAKWTKRLYGHKRKTTELFDYMEYQKNQQKNRNQNNDTSLKDCYINYISICDKDIFEYGLFEKNIVKNKDKYELTISEKYKPLQEKYPFIVNIFFDIFFPQFLRKIWYNK
jgi:hypothetical protein